MSQQVRSLRAGGTLLDLASAVDWKEIEFVLESTDQEADRPFADGWETIRFKIEDEDAEESQGEVSS